MQKWVQIAFSAPTYFILLAKYYIKDSQNWKTVKMLWSVNLAEQFIMKLLLDEVEQNNLS